nr:hypothetical protein [bacterium]
MADDSEKKLNFEQQLLKTLNQQVAVRQDELSISNALIESIKEASGITRGRNSTDAGLLNINREINRSILNQKEGLTDVGAIQKQIAKNQESINKANRVTNALAADLLPDEKEEINALLEQVDLRDDLNAQIEEQLKNVDAGVKGAAAEVEELTKKRDLLTDNVAYDSISLSSAAQQVLFTRMNAKGLERQNALRKEELAQAHLTNAAEKTKGFLLGGHATLFAAISAAVLKSSQLTNQFQQELGVSYGNSLAMRNELVNAAGASNDLFINSEKLQKSFFALAENTGVFFDLSSKSAETFTNLTERIGLAGAEAGNLTMLLRLQGKDTEATMSNLVGTASAALATSKSTASVKQILGDVASSSKGLQASLAANPGALAKAAVAARELGATLKDIEGTQKALLDFESSIGAELEAELLTGKQLNLERARAAALNNDLKTVSEELLKQGVDLASFGKMNVLQQEKMAAAMGMSRDAMGDMLLKQQTQNMTADEVRKKFGEQTYEQFKALSAQDKFNAATEKLKDLFVGVMTALTPVIDLLAMALQPIALIAKGLSMANEATGGFTNGLIGVGLTVLALTKKFGGLGDSIGKAFSEKITSKFKGALGGMDKAGAAAGAAGEGIPKKNPFGFLTKVDMKKVLAGAAAMLIVSASLFVTTKALQEFASVSWESIGMAGVSLLGLTAALAAIGAIMMSGVGAVAIIAGAGAMLIMASALAVLGVAIQGIGKGFAILAPTISALAPMATDIAMLAGSMYALGGAFAFMGIGAMALMPALPVLTLLAGLGTAAAALGVIGGGGGGAQSPGGVATTTAVAGGGAGGDIRAIVEETVTATINALVPEMVAALKEGQGKIQVTNDNFTNSKQSEGPSRNRNIVNNNFA